MFDIALRMARHRLTSLVAVACAALGGAALVTATGVLTESGLRSHAPTGRLGGADIIVTAPQTVKAPGNLPAVLPERSRVDRDIAARLAGVAGVDDVISDVTFPAALLAADGHVVATADARSAGRSWSSVELLPTHRTVGAAPSGADEIALGSSAAAAARADVGDTVRVVAAGKAARPFRVSAVVAGGGNDLFFGDAAVTASRSSSQVDLFGLRVDADSVGVVADAVRDELRGTGLVVSTGAGRGDAAAPDVAAARGTLLLVASSLAGIVVMLVGFVVTGAVSVSVAGQRRTLALIRSVGGTPRQVRRLVATETSMTAAVASLPGIALGYLIAGRLGDLLRTTGIVPESLPLTFSPLPALAGVASMIVVAQLAARAASWRMSRMPAVDAMTESTTEPRQPSIIRERIGLLVMLAALGLGATPLFVRSELGAAMTSMAGIVAAIGFAVAAPGLLRRVSDAAVDRVPSHASAPTWLAVTNLRVFTTRFAGIITASAMLLIFTLTYAMSQTTLLRAGSDTVRVATVAQWRVTADALGGVPADLAAEIGRLDAVQSVSPVSATAVIWPQRVLGDLEVETQPAMILSSSSAEVLDLDVREGSLGDLTGPTVAIGTDVARSRHTGVGKTVKLTLGDGTETRARVVAVYARQLGLGSIALSDDLALQHTTTGLDQSLLVSGDDTVEVKDALAELAASRPGIEIGPAVGDPDTSVAAPTLVLNIATIAVLLGYLALTLANRIVAVTAQRRGEIAALRTAGATRAQILGMTRREAMIAATVSCGGALLVSAVPLLFLGIGFLGRPWPSAPVWLVPGTVVLVVGLIVASVELPVRRLLRSSPIGSA